MIHEQILNSYLGKHISGAERYLDLPGHDSACAWRRCLELRRAVLRAQKGWRGAAGLFSLPWCGIMEVSWIHSREMRSRQPGID
jgi:hypothetical protein